MMRMLLRAAAAALCVAAACAGNCTDLNGQASCVRHLRAYATKGGCRHVIGSDELVANYEAGWALAHYCERTCGVCMETNSLSALPESFGNLSNLALL